jgi:hypothetical protein
VDNAGHPATDASRRGMAASKQTRLVAEMGAGMRASKNLRGVSERTCFI